MSAVSGAGGAIEGGAGKTFIKKRSKPSSAKKKKKRPPARHAANTLYDVNAGFSITISPWFLNNNNFLYIDLDISSNSFSSTHIIF